VKGFIPLDTGLLEPLDPGFFYFDPQLEQLPEEHVPQDEPPVLLKVPPMEKAQADIILFTFLLLHSGQEIFSEELKTIFSNSWLHFSH
jgi:hypothetical protein